MGRVKQGKNRNKKSAKPSSTTTTTSSTTPAPATSVPPRPTTSSTETTTMPLPGSTIPQPPPGAVPMDIARDCPACATRTRATAVLTRLPHWDRDVAATRIQCHACGHTSTKYTAGTQPTAPHGEVWTLTMRHPRDLDRDLLKSEFATLEVPWLGLELDGASLAGTLCSVRELLAFVRGDVAARYAQALAQAQSEDDPNVQGIAAFLGKISKVLELEAAAAAEEQEDMDHFVSADLATVDDPFTVILRDAAGNSWMQMRAAGDKQIVIETFVRTPEMNEKFGFDA
ncbi:hypothetical protein AMAG_11079 [Allomyces macrogynus ATCC 38327]|uniref:Zinc finger ZPR1-type domain-containing protein n=1 Tax=Allomyces macrogynus (strain ATCC 38327) TaxID=578462 RepID=A0A0L0ST09_ALLM3|nr:hypothetical protein AMAG_11079 [Allomyces macrogynus ATCC 38327]|eukprot:KNE65454.1 hypothetical protein AMAG_11079 [Allomyces macrogynus ATCC 38327]